MKMVTAPRGWASRCTPLLTQRVCSAVRSGLAPHEAAERCGLYYTTLWGFLRRGEETCLRGEETCYSVFFVAFVLALSVSPRAPRFFRDPRWGRRYWIALSHPWLAEAVTPIPRKRNTLCFTARDRRVA